MPSIPQSLLWISLVVLWLFVLVPMLVSKRDAVRRTSDVALATRVLNSGAAGRLLKRGGPAAGHRSNPDWQPDQDEYDDLDSDETEEMPLSRGPAVTVAAAVSVEETQPEDLPEDLDVEVDDADSAELPADDEQPQPVAEIETEDEDTDAEFETEDADDEGEAVEDEDDDQYEYVDDTSGIPVAEEPPATVTHAFARRHRYDENTAAAVSARKYAFRRKVLLVMALTLIGSAATAFLRDPDGLVVLRQRRRGDGALPGISAQADPDRGASAASPDAADGPVAAGRGERL